MTQTGGTPLGPSRDVQDIIPTRMAMTPAAPEPAPEDAPPAEAATSATAPVDRDAPTVVSAFADPAATVVSNLADPEATRMTGQPGTSATGRPSTGGFSRSDAPTMVAGQESGSDSGASTGSKRFTSTYTKLGRTRTNAALAADTQQLDLKLQLSRPSVLADMGRIGPDRLPPGIAKLIEEHGTEGRYAVEQPLAQGGMGAVLLIKDGDFQRPAAMKVMLSRFTKSPEALERFLAEAQVTAQLEHPNIVPIHDMGIMEDGTVYFTMKYIRGESLGSVVKKLKGDDAGLRAATRAEWPDERLVLAFLKVLDGVGYAHSKGVVHRDLKPDNVMLGGHGEVLVVDWGIAKVLGRDLAGKTGGVAQLRDGDALSHTVEGSAMGTLYYMPPEQATGDLQRIGPHSDVYALGATLYELMTIKRPVSGASAADVLAKVISGEVTPVKEARPDLNDDLAAIITKAMAHAPEKRYPTCSEFAEDVRRYLAGVAVSARRRNLVERTGAWLGRNRRKVAAGAAVTAMAVAIAFATVAWLRREADRRADALVAQARGALHAERWSEAHDAAVAALGIRPSDRDAIELRESSAAGLAVETRLAKEAAAAAASRENAVRLAGEARAAAEAMRWEDARDKAKASLEAAPTPEAQDVLARASAALADKHRRELEAKAAERKAAGDALLAQARGLKPLDPALGDVLAKAREAYARAAADGIAVAGADEAVAEVTRLQSAADAARTQAAREAAAAEAAAARRKQADEAIAAAAAALAKGDLDAAADQAAAARKLEPADERAAKLREDVALRIRDRDSERDRAAAREQARKTASEALERARAAEARMTAAAGERTEARAKAERLSIELAALPAERKKPLFEARAAAEKADAAIAEQWALAEGAARTALDTLASAGDGDGEPAKAARTLLIGLYNGRLADARAKRALPEIAAFTNLLARLGVETATQDAGTLAVAGPSAVRLAVHRLDEDGTGRFAAADKPVAELLLPAQPVKLPAGRYELHGGDQIAAVVVEAGAEARIAWAPSPVPAVPGSTLRWVPPLGSAPGFWLDEREVTIGQWADFLADPAILAEAKAAWKKAYENPDAEASIALVPRRSPLESTWNIHVADQAQTLLARIEVPNGTDRHTPVTGISRDDAARYCRWLAERSGRKVRLPTAGEWRRAADGGDGRRLYPWGPGFDWTFAATALPKREFPPPVGSAASDRGPFGHRDLAGSVREWLGDRPANADDVATAGVHGALVAGGGFQDEKPIQFQTTWNESVPPAYTGAAIGFRILVEP